MMNSRFVSLGSSSREPPIGGGRLDLLVFRGLEDLDAGLARTVCTYQCQEVLAQAPRVLVSPHAIAPGGDRGKEVPETYFIN